jgi:NAD(P)-dependent dehydrogenase (short-subunit alcohol dehydrogenase family)
MANETIAVVGAGPGVGMGVARKFGREGYRVALVARSQKKLDGYVAELKSLGIDAAAFPADVTDRPGLAAALERANAHFGGIDALEYSPMLEFGAIFSVDALTIADLQKQLEFQLFGAITAVNAVLPGMIKKGKGSLLFTTGPSALGYLPSYANNGLAIGAMRLYGIMLNEGLAHEGIYAGSLMIAAPFDPAKLADIYFDMTQKRDRAEVLWGDPNIVIAYNKMVMRGYCPIHPPSVSKDFPEPKDEAERRIFLLALWHIQTCLFFIEDEAQKAEQRARVLAHVKRLKGDPNAPLFGTKS